MAVLKAGCISPLADEVLLEAVQAFEQFKNKQHAADHLGLPVSTFKTRIKTARKRGLMAEPALEVRKQSILYDQDGQEKGRWDKLGIPSMDPEDRVQLPDPRTITKVSTLYDQEGRVTQQWVAEKPAEIVKETAWRALADELSKDLPRAKPVVRASKAVAEDLMACYPVGDHHLGMLSWKDETGADYDLDIGERLLCGAADFLYRASIPCQQALIVFLGDFMHYDSFAAVTPTSGHHLDADSRFPKMVRTAIRCMRYMIEGALKRHGKVHVIVEIGNHDLASSIFLMECLRNVYENEPRITIDNSPKHYHYYRFGSVLIGSHHGHGAKPESLPLIMATDVPQDWGATKHRYIWTGHVHHRSKLGQIAKDHPGVEVESFRILAPADAWASQKGYRSASDMKAIMMHREFGEIARHTVIPQMLSLE